MVHFRATSDELKFPLDNTPFQQAVLPRHLKKAHLFANQTTCILSGQ